MNRAVRARFTKIGKIRFTSQRDVARIWERGLRRADLPIAYTEGFSPRPKLSFGFGLSTGYESLGEYLDINLRSGACAEVADRVDTDYERLPARLDPVLPDGMELQVVVRLPAGTPSLQQAVTSCTWLIALPETVSRSVAQSAVDGVLAAPELMVSRERKGETITEDVRPGILDLQVLDPSSAADGVVLEAELAMQPRAVRPVELFRALGPGFHTHRVVRIHQWTQTGGARQEVIPLPSAATPARTLEARAS